MASRSKMDILLTFDVEDTISPPEVGNDDSIKELADILTEEGLVGTFLFIGERAEVLRQRNRTDVIQSLRPHEVGLHTLTAKHPCAPEYVAGLSWEEGVSKALEHERRGVELIESVFGKPACAISSHYEYSTPQSQRAAALLGLPYIYATPAAPPTYNLSWFAGALGLPYDSPTLGNAPFRAMMGGFDESYWDDHEFEKTMRSFDEEIDRCIADRQPFVTALLYHPQQLRLKAFIDQYWFANGANFPKDHWKGRAVPPRYSSEEVQRSLKNFRKHMRMIAKDPRLNVVTVADIVKHYGRQPEFISQRELQEAARKIITGTSIPLHDRYSPAEILVALATAIVSYAESGTLQPTYPRLDVMGPVEVPIIQPEIDTCSFDQVVGWARTCLETVRRTQHLPANFGPKLSRIGVNHLHHLLAHCLISAAQETELTNINPELYPVARYPDIAYYIGLRYASIAEMELVDPNINIDAVFRHGKLQTWTLKSAIGA